MVESTFFSPKKTRMAGEKENNSAFNVRVDPVQVANINKYNEQTPSLDYAPDRVGDYIRDTKVKSYRDDRTQDEKDQDSIKNFFTREDGGVFKDNTEFDRKMTTYYTDKDGNPAAVDAFGERVYDTDKIKKYIAADAKEKYQKEQQKSEKQKLDQGLSKLQEMNQRVDDFNYYKRNLDFNRKGEPDPANKYVLTAPEMRERMKDLDRNESMDKYGIIRPYKEQEKINRINEAERNRLQQAKEESKNKNVFQKIGDTVGDVFNKLTGTLPAKGDTLQSQGINTNATVSIAQMGNVSPSVQKSRDAVARSNLRKSGLNRTVGGQSSQANYGRSRKGFGTGTHGKGMPSNPKGMRQQGVGISANNLSRHSVGHSSTQPGSTVRRRGAGAPSGRAATGQGNKGNQGGNQGGDSGDSGDKKQTQKTNLSRSRRRGGSKSSGGGGSSSGGSTGGTTSGRKMNRSRRRRRCDVRCKIDISPLINSNLVKDDLAKVAYFVQEIK